MLDRAVAIPTPSRKDWPYAEHRAVPDWVRSREAFVQALFPHRIANLREKIAVHAPRVVVFYFWKPREYAEAVAGGEFTPLIPEKLLGLKRNGTAYFITGHPAGRYLPDPDGYFSELGHYFQMNHADLFASQKVPLLQKAIRIATRAHQWQKRRNGTPYILHPLRVMARLRTESEQIVGVLHDVVEDTHWTFEDLRREGFPEPIIRALDGMTKRDGESYEVFVARVATNPIALRVKLADLQDNMDVRELPELTLKDTERLAKYLKAWRWLREKEDVEDETEGSSECS